MKTFTFYAVFCTSIYFSHQQLFTFLLFFFSVHEFFIVCMYWTQVKFFSTIFYWIIYTATRKTTDVVWKRMHFSICIHFLTIFLQVNFYRYSQKFGEETFSYVLTPPQTFSIKRRPVWAKKQKSAKFRKRQAEAEPERQQQQQRSNKNGEREQREGVWESARAQKAESGGWDTERNARAQCCFGILHFHFRVCCCYCYNGNGQAAAYPTGRQRSATPRASSNIKQMGKCCFESKYMLIYICVYICIWYLVSCCCAFKLQSLCGRKHFVET